MAKTDKKQIKVTLVRSYFGRLERHKATVRGLGLRRMHHTVSVQDTPENRGMIASISDMLRVEE
ncbi:MAG TPA: 50S ribosomal protein L30 [Gammaproteobacteria bacterium]|jgi:large subunit ribosomal protein L30|nr:50S ribosomal protein L30 [Gammaproteobacteria bacterium]